MRFAPNGKRFALFNCNRQSNIAYVQLWQLEDREPFVRLLKQHKIAADEVAFSPELDTFASAEYPDNGRQTAEIKVRDLVNGTARCNTTFTDSETQIRSLDYSREGRFLIAVSLGGGQLDWKLKTTVWDIDAALAEMGRYAGDPGGMGTEPELSPDGRWMIVKQRTGGVAVDSATFAECGKLVQPGDAGDQGGYNGHFNYPAFVFSGDSKMVLMTGLWHHSAPSPASEWLPDWLNWGNGPYTYPVARMWEVATARQAAVFPHCLEGMFSPDGRRLATVQADDTILVWDSQSLLATPRTPAAVGVVLVLSFAGGLVVAIRSRMASRSRH